MKNITLSADDKLIQAARLQAQLNGRTLNQEFREWLTVKATTPKQRVARYQDLMKRFKSIDAGRKFTREEMNER